MTIPDTRWMTKDHIPCFEYGPCDKPNNQTPFRHGLCLSHIIYDGMVYVLSAVSFARSRIPKEQYMCIHTYLGTEHVYHPFSLLV